MEEVQSLLRQVMGTGNRLTLPVSGTGSAGMETCFVNLIEPGDPVLILVNGVFGQRMADVATRLRAEVDTVEFPWGTPVVPEAVRGQLAQNPTASWPWSMRKRPPECAAPWRKSAPS